MSIVKGTKQHRVKVIEDRPFMRWGFFSLILMIMVAAVFASHKVGFATGMSQQESALEDVERLEKELRASRSSALELEQKVTNINMGAQVDRQANEEIRQEVINLKEQIAQLQEENTFYRGLMAPTKNKRGLAFGAVELSQSERARTYNYKVVLQQLATNHQLLNGSLYYKVVGKTLGQDVNYPLNQLSPQINTELIKLRFKYFQTIEGELTLPEGFEPMAIELVAKSTGKNPVTVEKRFGWLVEEVL